jgi:hypothetical protein
MADSTTAGAGADGSGSVAEGGDGWANIPSRACVRGRYETTRPVASTSTAARGRATVVTRVGCVDEPASSSSLSGPPRCTAATAAATLCAVTSTCGCTAACRWGGLSARAR